MSPEEFQKLQNVSRETISRLETYETVLKKWQAAINLVSPKTLDDIWGRHFADSAQLSEFIPANSKVADLGSGAGFPGMVLAIIRPDLEVHLIESDNRKSEFLKNVSRETKCTARVYNDRVEKILGGIGADIITARAFAPLPELLEMIPSESRKAELILLKGKMALEEVQAAQKLHRITCENFPSKTDSEAYILKIRFT